jgi:hypothetical protein
LQLKELCTNFIENKVVEYIEFETINQSSVHYSINLCFDNLKIQEEDLLEFTTIKEVEIKEEILLEKPEKEIEKVKTPERKRKVSVLVKGIKDRFKETTEEVKTEEPIKKEKTQDRIKKRLSLIFTGKRENTEEKTVEEKEEVKVLDKKLTELEKKEIDKKYNEKIEKNIKIFQEKSKEENKFIKRFNSFNLFGKKEVIKIDEIYFQNITTLLDKISKDSKIAVILTN